MLFIVPNTIFHYLIYYKKFQINLINKNFISKITFTFQIKYNQIKFGDNSTYSGSVVETVVNNWSNDKFTNELATVGGYKARLIKYEELIGNLGYDPNINSNGNPQLNPNVPTWVCICTSSYC